MIGQWHTRTVTTVVIAAVLIAALPPEVFAAVDSPEFSALYVGNGDEYDFSVFSEHFRDHGWNSEVEKSSNYSVSGTRPRHYHFTHGAAGDMVGAADDGDILYVSGHGLGQAFIPIYDAPGGTIGDYIDSISPDTNCANVSPVRAWS